MLIIEYERWEKKKTCTFAEEKFNRWCSTMNADSRRQLDSCQTRGKISTRMESGSWWKLRKLGILFTRQTAFGSFRPSCSSRKHDFLIFRLSSSVRQLCPRRRQVFFFIISDSILVSDDDINLFHFLILDQRWKIFFEKNLKYLNPFSKDTREVSGKKSKEIFLINNAFACHNYITLNKINI